MLSSQLVNRIFSFKEMTPKYCYCGDEEQGQQ